MKVYCKECIFLEIDSMTLCEENIDYLCNYFDNKKSSTNWYDREIKETRYIREPNVINWKNDCKWYKEKDNK